MDELLVSWLGSDDVYENVLKLIEKYDEESKVTGDQSPDSIPNKFVPSKYPAKLESSSTTARQPIPPFYPLKTSSGITLQRRRRLPRQSETWDPLLDESRNGSLSKSNATKNSEGKKTPNSVTGHAAGHEEENSSSVDPASNICVRDQIYKLLNELQILPQGILGNDSSNADNAVSIGLDVFVRITKEICHFPSFFNGPLYQRIMQLWNIDHPHENITTVTLSTIEWYWKKEMEPFDASERFFRLVKQPDEDCILRDDFLPYIKALLNDHPVRARFATFWLAQIKQINL